MTEWIDNKELWLLYLYSDSVDILILTRANFEPLKITSVDKREIFEIGKTS